MPKKIMIIDDDDTCRFLYRYHFRGVSEVEIIAEFDNAEDALVQVAVLKPDIVIVDHKLPGMSGIEFIEKIQQHPQIKIFLVTGHNQDFFKTAPGSSLNIDIVQKDWSEKSVKHIIDSCS